MSDIIHTEPAPTFDDVWRLIQQTNRQRTGKVAHGVLIIKYFEHTIK